MLLLEDNRPQCSAWETGFCLPPSFLWCIPDQRDEKYEHWRGNLKAAYELFSPKKEQVAVPRLKDFSGF